MANTPADLAASFFKADVTESLFVIFLKWREHQLAILA
jgi:hypothetical protein